ncbi:MAG: hypothetical protein ACYDDF_02320 [Thermoplasmatota archaeon]
MFVNIMTARLKTPKDLAEVVPKVRELFPRVHEFPGVLALYLVKTSDRELVTVVVYGAAQQARLGLADFAPAVRKVMSDRLSEPPAFTAGEVIGT